MKTEKEIRLKLKEIVQRKKCVQKEYDEGDNYEDMAMLETLSEIISTLSWVLDEKTSKSYGNVMD